MWTTSGKVGKLREVTTQKASDWALDQPKTPGERLKVLRLEFGLSADAAAVAVGTLDGQSWRNYEQGKHEMKVGTVERIVRRFERREIHQRDLVGWLLLGGDKPPRPEPPFPFSSSITVGSQPERKRPPTRPKNRNKAYCSTSSRTVGLSRSEAA